MTPDEFRTLCSHREGPFLDFKESFYKNDDQGNAELAKDIMSIANGLSLQASGNILFGVREEEDGTGEVVGCELKDWVTDANLQQKVRANLNRMPRFGLSILAVDDLAVAAIEIRPGGRPFFGLRDKGNLRRNLAFIRTGSATDIASPDEILGWARQDEALGVRALEAEHLETQQILKPRLQQEGGSKSGHQQNFRFVLQNDGIAPFEPISAILRWSPMVESLRSTLAASHIRLLDSPPDLDRELPVDTRTVPSQASLDLFVTVERDKAGVELLGHLRPHLEGHLPPDANGMQFLNDFELTVIVRCRNILGTREKVLSAPVRLFP